MLFLVDDGSRDRARRFLYEQFADLAVRWGARPGSQIIRFFERKPGRRTRPEERDGLAHLITSVPENAAADVLKSFRPDVVISNSILRLTWRKVHQMCQRSGTATVLYVREVASMNHFTVGASPADVIVANAGSLARSVEELGYECSVLPSVIEIGVTCVDSSRRVALVINPIASHGIETVWQIARRLPGVMFVIQQSWPLGIDELAALERTVADLPNVEFRRAAPPGASLYGDIRLLLVPHRIDNRPRVIAEAQANGIPVIASHTPGLAEAVGDGGILIAMDDLDGWVDAVQRLWSDQQAYDELAEKALDHSRRAEIDPEQITSAFEALLREAVERTRRSAPNN